MNPLRNAFLLMGVVLTTGYATGQEIDLGKEIKTIEALILDDRLSKADSVVQKAIDFGKTNKSFDELAQLTYWSGKVELAVNVDKAFPKTIALSDFIGAHTDDPFANYRSLLDLSRLYNESGHMAKALEVAQKAMSFASRTNSTAAVANCHYYLGEYSLRSGNIDPFFDNIKKGHQILTDNPEKKYKIAARILNYMGAIKYFSSEPDSAYYFYKRALLKIGEMEDNLENRLYFPAAINANMVLLKQSRNEFEEALDLAEKSIVLNKEFLASSKKHPLRFRSQRNLSLAYRNLASLYEQLGDYDKSYQIAEIAYEHGKATFEPKLLEYFSAVTLLAEAKISKHDFDGALRTLEEAKIALDAMEGAKPLLEANYNTILGGALYGKKEFARAKKAYEKGNEMHLKAQNEIYSSDRLFAIMNLALCHARLDDRDAAYRILDEAYDHQTKNADAGRLVDALLMAKARVADILKDPEKMMEATQRFLLKNSDTTLNSASFAFKAEALALNTKSKYELHGQPDIDFLKGVDSTMTEAIAILEQRKAFIASRENINTLIMENKEVFDLAKRINLDLYRTSNDNAYLEKMIRLHESSIYHRIRSRLNLNATVGSFKLPQKTIERERNLKKALQESSDDFNSFQASNRAWIGFLDSLKTQYPRYYQMRYATLFVPLERLQENIPEASTIVRYLYIDEELFAYVATREKQHLVPIGPIDESDIILLGNFGNNIDKVGKACKNLYDILWEPIAPYVQTETVIVFPDRSLFNLNFELLTPDRLHTFNDFATQGLLAEHTFSYNYSLSLLGQNEKLLDLGSDFVAFAPSFDKEMKDRYALSIADSIRLDRTYMTLLPQPFSSELAVKLGKRFSGNTFLNQNASKQVFTQKAKEHKIIHIGTHAESNNINPGLSRLVFAKNVTDTLNVNDNYLYTYEIYDQDLSSNLAILTACETGKPTYQPGEGMISLAHAFNYAGSESILTSLWQIDEQSSSQILEFFYAYLEDGKPKDEALRHAKLDYLKIAEGRTLHPQYWAGLVLMGNTDPISLSSEKHWWIALGLVLALAFLGIFYFQRRKSA